MQDIPKRLGLNIKRLRINNGFSQDDLAKQLDADKAYVSRIENGKKNLTLSTLLKVANALGVSIGDLFR